MKSKIIYALISKRCSLLAVSILLSIFSGCNKSFLDEKPLDFLAPLNAYSIKEGIEQGINGLHVTTRDTWYSHSNTLGYSSSINVDLITLYARGTDEAFYGEDPGGSTFLNNYGISLNSTHSIVERYWRECYRQIQVANVLIDRIKTADNKIWTNDAEKNAFLGETMFFRAFAYRILVVLYGDIPMVTEVITTEKTDFTRASKTDVYKLIEDDFIYAAANLPEQGKEKAPGRLTQGAAWHMLADIYLAQSKFQLAVDAASKVINGYHYALKTQRFGTKLGKDIFGSGDVYFDLFSLGNQNLAENTEAIWVIQIEPLVTGGGESAAEGRFGPRYYFMGNAPDGKKAIIGELYNGVRTGYSDTLGRTAAYASPTNYIKYDIWRSDWNNDIRNARHNIKRNFYYDNPASIYYKQKIDFSKYPAGVRNQLLDTCLNIFPYWMKVAAPLEHYTAPDRSGNSRTHKDLYAIRLAETYLIRAEAYLGLGRKELAAEDINVVRNRAQATPVLPGNVDIDYILDERARELYTEEFRMITLMRLGKLVERVRKYNNNPLSPQLNIQDHNNLWPVPQPIIDLNIGAEMEQNPGY